MAEESTKGIPPVVSQPMNVGFRMGYPEASSNASRQGPQITMQPVSRMQDCNLVTGGQMRGPQARSTCSSGLQYLSQLDHLYIQQKVDITEVLFNIEANNKYKIKNRAGQIVYFAAEDNDCCTRMCCGPMRPFEMKIMDNVSNEVLHLTRPLACDACCFPCCLQSLDVSAAGVFIGKVEQQWSIFQTYLLIKNEYNEPILRIIGPCCMLRCLELKFGVYPLENDQEIGNITREVPDCLQLLCTDADNFRIDFPMDLDVKAKALLLGACFLIDFMFFEKSK